MRAFRFISGALLLLTVFPSIADVREDGKEYVVTMASIPCELRLQKDTWTPDNSKIEETPRKTSVSFNSLKPIRQLLVNLEKSDDCATSVSCRNGEWKMIKMALGFIGLKPTDVTLTESGEFASVGYVTAEGEKDNPITVFNVDSFYGRDKVKVSLHFQSVSNPAQNQLVLSELMKSIRVVNKPEPLAK